MSMTSLSPFRGVAVAAVARPVGTPGVQQVGSRQPQPATPLHRDRTGGVPPPPPRHPAGLSRCSTVRRGRPVGRPAALRRVVGTPVAAVGWVVGRVSWAVEPRNAGTWSRRLDASLVLAAPLQLRAVRRFPPSSAEVFAAAISTLMRSESEIPEAAFRRGLASRQPGEVTALVTGFAAPRPFVGLSRLLVPVTSP